MCMFDDSDDSTDIVLTFKSDTSVVDSILSKKKVKKVVCREIPKKLNTASLITDKDIEHLVCLTIFDEYDVDDYSELLISTDEIDMLYGIISNIGMDDCNIGEYKCDGCVNCDENVKAMTIGKIVLIFNKRKMYHTSRIILCERVLGLLQLQQPEQRSPEWYELRNGMVTTSDWASVMSDKKYKSPFSNRKQLLLKKCGISKPFTGSFYTEWGVKYEMVANAIYEHKYDTKIIEFGLIQHPMYSFLGASPDGISMDGIMLEIKCPPRRVISDKVPGYYWVQVQGQLEVCDLERCDFLQCKLVEYELFDYLQDTNVYRGCVIDYMNIKTNKLEYFYSEFCLDSNQIAKWEESLVISDYLIDRNISYWNLEKISCMPIYRDREWFEVALVELTEFWDEVTLVKQNGNTDDYLPKKRQVKNKQPFEPSVKLNYAFSDSESE
jgi:putative phage-type endonuclease